MKFTTTTTALALTGVAAASPAPPPESFELVLSSSDKSVDGLKISTCHAGAGIQATCLASEGSIFAFNNTGVDKSPVPNWIPAGSVTYQLPVNGGNETETLALNLVGDYASDVQEALFEPGNTGVSIAFSSLEQKAGIISYLNDKVTPPNATEAKAYTNWWACQTYYTGYNYQTLAWVSGDGSQKPQNPSCIKVDVSRQFVN